MCISNPDYQNIDSYISDAKKNETKAKKKDYYKILGVDKNSDDQTIKSAYKKMAKKWHPDKNNKSEEDKKHAEKMFRDINEANEILSDPKKKQMLDQGLDPNDPNGGMDFSSGGIDPSSIFSMFMGQGGGGRQGGAHNCKFVK